MAAATMGVQLPRGRVTQHRQQQQQQQQQQPSLWGSVPSAPQHMAGSALSAAAATAATAAAPTTTTTAAFDILVDEEFAPGGSGPERCAYPASAAAQPALPSYSTVRKENTGTASQWTGAALARPAAPAVAPAPRLQVCEDDEDEDDAGGGGGGDGIINTSKQQASELQPAQQPSGGVGLWQPLQVPSPQPGQSLTVQQPVAPAAALVPQLQQKSTQKAAVQVGAVQQPQGYDPALLLSPGGGERSFEEARAEAWRARVAARAVEQQELQQQQQEQQQQQQQQQQEKQQEKQQLEQQQQQQQQQQLASEPTVTLHTRAALDSINSMFSADATSTLHGAALASAAGAGVCDAAGIMGAASTVPYTRPRPRKSLGGVSAGEPTVTLHTRAAFDAVNGLFGGYGDDTSTLAHGDFGRLRSGGGVACPEPTVTINTRAAFEYMNDVFGDVTATQAVPGRSGVGAARVRHAHTPSWLACAAAAAAAVTAAAAAAAAVTAATPNT
jgi:hypothetical protein